MITNTIVPNKPVIADTGISLAVKVLERISTTIINHPPNAIDNGIVFLVFLPTSNLAMCGITNPTHPIVPEKATVVAVSNVAITIINVL